MDDNAYEAREILEFITRNSDKIDFDSGIKIFDEAETQQRADLPAAVAGEGSHVYR